jgi:hypothetical protein
MASGLGKKSARFEIAFSCYIDRLNDVIGLMPGTRRIIREFGACPQKVECW